MQIKATMMYYLMSVKRLSYKKKREKHERMGRKGNSFIHCWWARK